MLMEVNLKVLLHGISGPMAFDDCGIDNIS
jgi:hypothetical protein